mmetsp:Transcript_101204/g.291469  ORF Transcript_101204/g.291469 Transcript_101204/m.291469 type:complete len:279 (-) Transcript_101204:7-843(-)
MHASNPSPADGGQAAGTNEHDRCGPQEEPACRCGVRRRSRRSDGRNLVLHCLGRRGHLLRIRGVHRPVELLLGRCAGTRGDGCRQRSCGRCWAGIKSIISTKAAFEMHPVSEATPGVVARAAAAVPHHTSQRRGLKGALRARRIGLLATEPALLVVSVGLATKVAHALVSAAWVPSEGSAGLQREDASRGLRPRNAIVRGLHRCRSSRWLLAGLRPRPVRRVPRPLAVAMARLRIAGGAGRHGNDGDGCELVQHRRSRTETGLLRRRGCWARARAKTA